MAGNARRRWMSKTVAISVYAAAKARRTVVCGELRHQYSIGYKPSKRVQAGRTLPPYQSKSPPRGLPRLFVRSKEGYYALTGTR